MRRTWWEWAAKCLALATLVALSPAPAASEAGLVARWTFDLANGADNSGNGHTLLLGGAVGFVPGFAGTALQLRSGGAWGEHASSAAFVPGDRPWSVSAWIRRSTSAAAQSAIVTWYRCGALPNCSGPDAALYWLTLSNTGRPVWYLRDNAANVASAEGPGAIDNGIWVHLAGTWDPTTSMVVLYVNGAVADTVHAPLGRMDGVGVPLEVGRIFRTGWGTPGEYFAGDVDDVRIYEIALSAAQVAALADPGSVGAPSRSAAGVALGASAPNPLRTRSRIPFRLAQPADVRLVVHDVAGRTVSVLAEGRREAGEHVAEWDGRDASGQRVPGGVYFYRLTVGPGGGALVRRGTVLH